MAPAIVPPPDDIEALLVSSDPTTGWLSTYLYVTHHFDELTRRRMLYASAIPKMLVARISEFLSWDLTDETDQERCTTLNSFIYEKTYWTHRHKCHTNSADDTYRFKKGIARMCAATWLKDEIADCGSIKLIVALSGPNKDWFKDYRISEEIKIARVYHTSPRNRHIWYGEEKAKQRIEKLQNDGKTESAQKYKEQRKKLKREVEKLLKHVGIL